MFIVGRKRYPPLYRQKRPEVESEVEFEHSQRVLFDVAIVRSRGRLTKP
jgi:hypothetical protein